MHPDFLLSGKEEVYKIFGIPIIRRKRHGLNARQLAEWEAYDRLDPIGQWRDDFRMAELASLILNIAIRWGAGKKQVKLTDITDFMPQWDGGAPKEVKQQSVEEMKQIFKDIMQAQNQIVGRKKRVDQPPANLRRNKDG